jgi:hypothetical protein
MLETVQKICMPHAEDRKENKKEAAVWKAEWQCGATLEAWGERSRQLMSKRPANCPPTNPDTFGAPLPLRSISFVTPCQTNY